MTAVGEVLAEPNEPKELSFSAAVDDTPFKAIEDLTPYEAATTYNNFYEFGTDKSDRSSRARDDNRSVGNKSWWPS